MATLSSVLARVKRATPKLTFLETDMLSHPNLLPNLRHCFRFLDLGPVFEEERYLNFAYILEHRAKARKHFSGDVFGRQLRTDMLKGSKLECREVELVGESINRFSADWTWPRCALFFVISNVMLIEP
jgi:hypothetical protein